MQLVICDLFLALTHLQQTEHLLLNSTNIENPTSFLYASLLICCCGFPILKAKIVYT